MKDGFIKAAAAVPAVRVAVPGQNADSMIHLIQSAASEGVKLLLFPELCLTGYTCGDLFLQDALLEAAEAALGRVLSETAGLDILFTAGLPVRCRRNSKIYNCAAVCCRGELLGLIPKTYLPDYGEFYEERWFSPAPGEPDSTMLCGRAVPFGTDLVFCCRELKELRIGLEICEDLWVPEPCSGRLCVSGGATVILNPSASDELSGKAAYRRDLVRMQSARLLCAYLYAGSGPTESTTDLVFGGHCLIAENGTMLAEQRYEEGIACTELDVRRLCFDRGRMTTFGAAAGAASSGFREIPFSLEPVRTELTRCISRHPFIPPEGEKRSERCREIFRIQVLGLKKRMVHTRSKRMVIGISGGLDSTLAALVCAETAKELSLPPEAILAVTMPCFGTTGRTLSNAGLLSERLHAELRTVSIEKAVLLHFSDIGHDPQDHSIVYENAQARERTQVLMDLANGCGGLVIGTGDLSELALGWSTYNGDHMSMYAVNCGVPKTLVRHLVRWYADETADRELASVLHDILDTPVSPELLPAENGTIVQKTEELVGPYELHDFFLYYLIRWGFPPEKILRLAEASWSPDYSPDELRKWLRVFLARFFTQQFKRSCIPDGPKVGSVSLSPRGDWRMPSDAGSDAFLRRLDFPD